MAEVVEADVVRHGVGVDVIERLVDPYPVHALADHDRQLALVVEELRPARPPDRPAVAIEGRGWLEEVGRRGRRLRRVLLDPRAVRQVDGEDLARRRRRQVGRLRLRELASVVEVDRLAVETSPTSVARDLHPYSPSALRVH